MSATSTVPIRWDSVEVVREGLRSASDIKLLVCCFADKCSPVSRGLAKTFEEIRMGDSVPYAQIFILDDSDNQLALECNIKVFPAVAFFWEGKQATIQRNGWDEDNKLVGVTSKDHYVNMIRLLRELGEESKDLVLTLDVK